MRNTKTKQSLMATGGLLIAATGWGLIWYPYRLLQEAGIAGAVSTFYTYAVTVVVGFAIFARHLPQMKGMLGPMLGLGLAAGWTNLAYVLAIIDGEVMRIMLLFYLSPLWTLLLAHYWLGERTGPLGISAIIVSLMGAFIMLWQPDTGLPLPQSEAEWLGLTAGMAFALTNVLTRRAKRLTLAAKSLGVWVGVTFVALVFTPVFGQDFVAPQALAMAHWLMIIGIGLGLMVTTVGVQYGVTHTPVTRASVIFLFELVVAAFAAYWLAGESMDLREWVGGTLIVVASLFAVRAEEA
jgi:drug/metabolite transporter (DMT)-like permease